MSAAPAQPVNHGKPQFLRTLLRCYACLLPYKRIVTGAYTSVIIINGLNMVIPQIIRLTIDKGIDAGDIPQVGQYVILLLGLTLVKGVFIYFQGKWSEVASQNVAYDLRQQIQKKLTILSFSYHDRSENGELLSRAIQDVERIRFLTGRASTRILEAVILMLVSSVILFSMNASLAWMVVISLPLISYQAVKMGGKLRPLSAKIQKQLGALTTQVEQNLRGARVVKAFAQEQAEIERFEHENSSWMQLSWQSARVQSIQTPLLYLLANLSTVAVLGFGGAQVVQGKLTLGELVAFLTYVGQIVYPLRMMGMIIPAVTMAGAAAERVFEILDAITEVKDNPDAIEMPEIKGHIHLENIQFMYGRHHVLKGITLDIQLGEIVALLGMTGSGKSSLINLIPRFYDPTQGRILVDGYDLRSVKITSLRAQIGIVLQETTLFATSIRENIAFGMPSASMEDIIRSAKAAQAHDFITDTPKGYQTPVGERGITLSGGQKQRIAIARAILLNPKILLLDDALSSVDTETEHKIQAAINNLVKGRTTLIIAHRLSTLQLADRVVVLDGGKIAAQGTHTQLLECSSLYQDIYNQQILPIEKVLAFDPQDLDGEDQL
jgi:ATP-binding cassette subfamily B multidrug efflux pump